MVLNIDLSLSHTALVLDPSFLLHQKQFQRVVSWIENTANNYLSESSAEYSNQTITVLGTRGSGKTTFLLSLLKSIKEKDINALAFDIIDPTLIEEKGNVFLNLISAINEQVEKLFDSANDFDKNIEKIRTWESVLNKMTHGLPSIDGVGNSNLDSGWQDPEYIMEKGIQSLQAARNIKESFSELVNYALLLLEKKYMVFIFDDVDTDFKKGWPILEMVRKYFSKSKVVIVVSGNLNMYTLAVRRHYMSNLGDVLMNKKDSDGSEDLVAKRILLEMESQYLLKVLKPERRVHLTTLYEKIEENKNLTWENRGEKEIEITVQYGKEETDKKNIVELYGDLLQNFGVVNNYQSEAYSSYLLSLPLRTQIRLLSNYSEHRNNLRYSSLEETFLSEMLDRSIDIDLIRRAPQLINIEILKFLLREKSLGELYQLQPVTSQDGINSSLIGLTFVFVQKMSSDSYLLFDYLIKIGYVRNLLTYLNYETYGPEPSLDGLCKHSGVLQNKVLRDIVGNMTSYLRGVRSGSNESWAGMIFLPGLGVLAKQSQETVSNRVDVVFNKLAERSRILGYLPLSLCSSTTSNRSTPTYSFYTLIGAIGELVRKTHLNDLTRGLKELSQIRAYSVPDFARGTFSVNINSSFDADDSVNTSNDYAEFQNEIMSWVFEYPSHAALAPHLLGKISTRMFYAFNNLDGIEIENNLGEFMNTRMVTFLNSILVEEARENVVDFQNFNINNTGKSSKILNHNLEQASLCNPNLFPLSRWLFRCPLLVSYLKTERSVIHAISKFAKTEVNDLFKGSIYGYLRNVDTRQTFNEQNSRVKLENLTFREIADIFMKNDVPFRLFTRDANPEQRRKYNSLIRDHMDTIFGDVKWNSQKIRDFREHIAKNKIKW